MRLLIHLILRLIGVVLLCLACTIGWVLVDAHRSIESDTAASADRVAATLQNLYWRDLLWRDGTYRDALLPVPDYTRVTRASTAEGGRHPTDTWTRPLNQPGVTGTDSRPEESALTVAGTLPPMAVRRCVEPGA